MRSNAIKAMEAKYGSAASNEKVWGMWAAWFDLDIKGENGSQENSVGDSGNTSEVNSLNLFMRCWALSGFIQLKNAT